MTLYQCKPKYYGSVHEYDQWERSLRSCIKSNNWKDESKIMELIPGCLYGQAWQTYKRLDTAEKQNLEIYK